MSDITRQETQDKAKENILQLFQNMLQTMGLDPKGYNLSINKEKSSPKPPPNVQVFQTAAYLSATMLSPVANQIFMYFLSQSGFENFVGIDQKTLAEELDTTVRNVNRGIKELLENGVILKTKKVGDLRRNDYFLNPMSAWKGKILNRKIALDKLEHNDPNQLHLFGETIEEGKEREGEEIKRKRPNLFKEKEKEFAKKGMLKASNAPKIVDVDFTEDFD